MNHKLISFIKSGIRIFCLLLGFILLFVNLIAGFSVSFFGLIIAEVLGVVEELVDKRKEE